MKRRRKEGPLLPTPQLLIVGLSVISPLVSRTKHPIQVGLDKEGFVDVYKKVEGFSLQAWLDPGTQVIHWYPVSPHLLTDSFIRFSLMERRVQQARILTSAAEKTILAYKSLNQSSQEKLYWRLIG